MIANPHDERRLGRGARQPVLPWWALRPDSVLRNMPGAPLAPIPSGYEILSYVPPQIAAPWQEAMK